MPNSKFNAWSKVKYLEKPVVNSVATLRENTASIANYSLPTLIVFFGILSLFVGISRFGTVDAAFSAVSGRGSAVESGSTDNIISVSPSSNITVGKIAIVSCVADSEQTSNGSSNDIASVSDTDGHTWTKAYEETDSDGADNDGSETALFWTKVTAQIDTSDSINCNFTSTPSDSIIMVFEATVGAGNTVETVVGTPAHSDTANILTASISSLTSREYLLVGNFGGEGEDNAKTPDSSYTELFDLRTSTSGALAANIQSHVQYRIATLTSDTVDSGTGNTNTFTNGTNTVVAFYEVAEPSNPTLTQNDWRIYSDDDTLAITANDPWPSGATDLAENSALQSLPPANDPIDPTDEIRIRMSIAVSDATLSSGGEGFILQYKETNDCTDATSWTDVAAADAGSVWEFATSTITDNSTLTTNKLTVTDVAGRYNKSDPSSTNPNSVTAGQDMEWDWHLEYVGPTEAHTYCFRMIRDDSTTLSAYNSDSYPKVDTRPGANDLMRHGNFFSTGTERGFFWTD